MTDFEITRERDAWSVIRGFVYQVELTIDRWLSLRPDEVLELERGEDIDTIQRAMTSAGEEQARLLEQIKVRDTNLTLRSDAARAALASFFEHYQANPTSNLSFRYVTNARIGTERDSPASGGSPLIPIWEQIRSGSLEEEQESDYLRILRGFLVSTSKPADLNEKTWKTFVDFISNAPYSDVLRLVKSVHWVTDQVDTADITEQLQKQIARQYSMTAEQADNVYLRLFLYVFKRLSVPGTKHLTREELARQIALPALNAADSVLVNQLSIFIRDLGRRVETLEGQMSALRQVQAAEISLNELREACRKITSNSINKIIEGQRLIVRRRLRDEVGQLLTSPTRYLFVVGASGVGKSTALSLEAEHLAASGWTVILLTVLPGELFTLDYAAELIRRELVRQPPSLEWHQIVGMLSDEGGSDLTGVVVLLDAVADADRDHIAQQFTLLNESLAAASLNRAKVIASCRDVEFEDLLRNPQMPFFVNAADISRPTARAYRVVTIGDFNTDELDRALTEVGAVELLGTGREDDRFDPHVATLRDLLKHPGTFEHYASLHASDDVSSLENVTWSGLIERRLNYALREAARRSRVDSDDQRKGLITLAKLGRDQRTQDFLVDYGEVNNRLPEWFVARSDTAITPYEALISCGMLLEQPAPENKILTGFRITDAGAYLLSFPLEQEITDAPPESAHEVVKGWIDEAWNYSLLLDSVLALIDRLSVAPRDPRLLLILDTILDTHQNRSLFRLMRPAVLSSIFELLKRDSLEQPYNYREAAVEVRPSAEALEIVRRHLRDINGDARRLAAKLVGLHRDEESIPELIRLLEDNDEDVRREAFTAFSYVGRSAIPLLLDALKNGEKSEEVLSRYVNALRNIGIVNGEVSAALAERLSVAHMAGDVNSICSALLAAARLRDRSHTAAAIEAIGHANYKVVHAAGKLLTEAPDPSAFHPLLDALRPNLSAEGKPVERYFVPSQLMAALTKTDRDAAEPELVKIIEQGLHGAGELSAGQAINKAQSLDLVSAYPILLNHLVSELQHPPPHKMAWRTSDLLGDTWHAAQLEALSTEAGKLFDQGIDIASLCVEAIRPNMPEHDKFPMGDRLNRVKDLNAGIKCQAANFVPEASRLLEHASSLSTDELCRYLWVAGDWRAEDFLLAKLEQSVPEWDRADRIRAFVMRALGTCGTTKGARAVLDYLRSEESVSLYFQQETLHPLLKRGVLAMDSLAEIASDSHNSPGGRACSLVALAELDARGHTNLFAQLVNDDEELVQLYAVRLLGFTREVGAVVPLRQILRSDKPQGLKAQAAESLGWLEARDAINDIEDAFDDTDDSAELTVARFLSALSHFRAQSSLPLLLRRLQSAPHHVRRYYLEALGAFSHEPQGEQALLDQFEECITEPTDFFDNQSSLIEGLIQYSPELLLSRFNVQFDRGRLTSPGRIELARSISYLYKTKKVEPALLLQAMKRLACDRDVSVRDRASHSLRFMDAAFCQQLYQELRDDPSADEWIRASAVWTLGYWDSDLAEIESARYAEESLVRLAADEALLLQRKQDELERHLNTFSGADGVARLSSYLCLLKQGTLSTIWRLHDSVERQSLAHTYVRHLTDRVSNRLRNEYKKRQEAQEKFFGERGTVHFD
jgi:HEAT repeat protein